MTATQGGARPSVIVISDWLANCRSGQWTPFEAATALKDALAKEGYAIVDPYPDSKLEAYRKALELAEDALNTIATFAEDNGKGAVDKSDGQAWAAHARAVREVCKALAGARP